MSNLIKILSLVAIIMVSSVLIFSTEKEEKTDIIKNADNDKKQTSETYKIKALKIPESLNFAGEYAPLTQEDIRERIDRELLVNTYWQSNGLLLIKKAHKFFPIIEPILKKNGIPDDFKYLAVIESGLSNVTSPAGAKGFWQIMQSTAREKGLEVNSNVDERYNLEKSTQAACDYLNEAYEKFGNWTLAAASYNAGKRGISRRMETQMVDSYYDLLLVSETARYIPRVLAIKEILSNPKNYGFIYDQDDLYNLIPTKTVKVDTVITNIAVFSKNLGINYKIMKLHNPWLRENKLNNASRRMYEIKIPIEK